MKTIKELIISVVGVGQIGGSFALALRDNRIGKKIIGVDKEEILSDSKIKESVNHTTPDLKSAVKESDFIFLSTPVLTILELLPRIISWMKPGAILLDSGSTKEDICLHMSKYPQKILIGGHPMTGTEKAGFEASSPLLFQDKIFALTFVTKKSVEAKAFIHKILEKIGAFPLEIDAERHDDIVSLTSHLPYVLSLSLSLLAKDFIARDSSYKNFMASGFKGATRLSLTHEEMGKGILTTNSSNILKMINELTEKLKTIGNLIRNHSELLDFLSTIRNFQSRLTEKNEGLR